MTPPTGEQTWMKPVRMWNRLGIPCVTRVFTTVKITLTCEAGQSMCLKSNKRKPNECSFTAVLAITKCWHVKFRHVRRVWFVKNWKELVKSSGNRQLRATWTPMVSPRYRTRLFHAPWRDPVHVHIRISMCGTMWDVEHSPAMVSLNIY